MCAITTDTSPLPPLVLSNASTTVEAKPLRPSIVKNTSPSGEQPAESTQSARQGCYTNLRIAHRSFWPCSAEPMRRWRNWQTHKLEVLAPQGIGVQVPSSAPIQNIFPESYGQGYTPPMVIVLVILHVLVCALSGWRRPAPAGQVGRSRREPSAARAHRPPLARAAQPTCSPASPPTRPSSLC